MRDLIVTENITLDGVIDAREGWFMPGDDAGDLSDVMEALRESVWTQRGHFTFETTGTATDGRRFRTTFAMQGDPGYAATAVMLGESGLCLALDDLPAGGGVLTPATAMGTRLADRLRAAGARIETVVL